MTYTPCVTALHTATAASVSRMLTKAGHQRGEWLASSRVRGWGNQTAGFVVKSEVDHHGGYVAVTGEHCRQPHRKTGRVLVSYDAGSWGSREGSREDAQRREAEALAATVAADPRYHVEIIDDDSPTVLVTRKAS